jgi:hypothetical protein
MVIGLAAFICWFAAPHDDLWISGDWRDWGFDEDPLAPLPKPEPDRELELV